ncbi:MAG: glycosyltransferase family 39 protein [Candidatus Eisenbacteria bacterium]
MVRLRGDRALWLITLLGAALRFLNLRGDLPCVLHYDEPTLVDNAVWMWSDHTLNPHFFNYPTGMIYLLAALFGLILLGGTIGGQFAGWSVAVTWLAGGTYPRPPQGGVLYFYPTWGVTTLYLIARSVSALAGTATIPLVYAIARRIGCSLGASRLAAFAVAVSSLMVEHSHLATTDAAATCLATAALLLILRAEQGSTRSWLLAGAATGLAAGFKYNLGLVAALLALLAVWRLRVDGSIVWRRLALAAAASIAAFLMTTPYALIDAPRFTRDLGYEFHRVSNVTEMFQGAKEIETSSAEKLLDIFGTHLGPFGMAAALVGLWFALRTRRFAPTAVAAWVLICLLPMLRWQSLYARYLVGPWPMILLLAIVAIWELMSLLSRSRARLRPLVAGALTVAVLLPSEIQLLKRERTRSRPDPRVELSEWLEQNLPHGVPVVGEKAGPFPNSDLVPIEVTDFLGRSTPEKYLDRGVQYLIETGRAKLIAGKAPFREVQENQEAIRRQSDVLWSKERYRVYKLRGGPTWLDAVTQSIATKRLNDARRTLEAAIQSEPNNRLAWQLLGETAAEQGDTLVALAALQAAADYDSLQPEVALYLSKLHIARREYTAAIHRLSLAAEGEPDDPTVLNNFAVAYLSRARGYLRAGERAQGEADWRAALDYARRYQTAGKGDPRFNTLLEQVERQGVKWGFANEPPAR